MRILIMWRRDPATARLSSICIILVASVREVFQPPAHAADVATLPVEVATVRTDTHRRSNPPDARRKGPEKPGIGEIQQRVAQGAAAERIQGPVEGEPPAEFLGAGVDADPFEHDRPVARPADLDETPVAGQQDALFRMRLFDEIAIASAARGDRRVVAGDAQPPAETRQHLVTEEA
jgi:hypothetical protein